MERSRNQNLDAAIFLLIFGGVVHGNGAVFAVADSGKSRGVEVLIYRQQIFHESHRADGTQLPVRRKLRGVNRVGNQHAFIGTIYIEEFGYYIPNTFVKGDIRDYGKNRKRIVSIFRRKQTEAEYTEITYLAKNVNWDNITFPVKYNLLLDKIKMDNGTHS